MKKSRLLGALCALFFTLVTSTSHGDPSVTLFEETWNGVFGGPTSISGTTQQSVANDFTATNDWEVLEVRWTGFFRNWRSDGLLAKKGVPSAIDSGAIDRFLTQPAPSGRVAIVGAGPGDPDLLTLKALQRLQDADVIIYDRLVGPGVLDYARRDADTIYVGKAPGKHSHSQDEINALLAYHAGLGKQVVRLKGGDPFIFGRGGEERAYLVERGIEVKIVPGITAAAGCAAEAGIPLTHRGTAQSVTYLTGTSAGDVPDYDWPALARTGGTLVIYMGVGTAKIIATRLMDNGLAAATPVAVIENGTLPTQRTVTGTLGELGTLVRSQGVRSPALLLIGDVVDQAEITADGTANISVGDQPVAVAS